MAAGGGQRTREFLWAICVSSLDYCDDTSTYPHPPVSAPRADRVSFYLQTLGFFPMPNKKLLFLLFPKEKKKTQKTKKTKKSSTRLCQQMGTEEACWGWNAGYVQEQTSESSRQYRGGILFLGQHSQSLLKGWHLPGTVWHRKQHLAQTTVNKKPLSLESQQDKDRRRLGLSSKRNSFRTLLINNAQQSESGDV